VPYIEKTENGVLVKVGQNQAHPMEQKHYIEWIQVMTEGMSYRKFLQPGDAPEAEFPVRAEDIQAREYCNIHGLWKS
jgi:superoxide reductase